MFSTVNAMLREKAKKNVLTKSCGGVLWIIINICMLRRWHMSIRIATKVELIVKVVSNGFHTQRSTLRRLRRIYPRRTSLGRIVKVDDDACVHEHAPALVVVPIRRMSIFGGGKGGRW